MTSEERARDDDEAGLAASSVGVTATAGASAPAAADTPEPGEPGAASPRAITGWNRYAWANQAWNTTGAAVLAGPWLLALATNAVGERGVLVNLGIVRLRADAFPSAMVALAAIVQVALLPLSGALVDGSRARHRRLAGACVIGALSCALLGTPSSTGWWYAGVLFVIASFAEGVSDLVYNGMLPALAPRERRDAVSSTSTAWGYLGGGALLAVNLLMLQLHDAVGLSQASMVRWCFVSAALWWVAIGLPATRLLNGVGVADLATAGSVGERFAAARSRLRAGFRLLRELPTVRRYLISYLCYADAVTAVVTLASTYLTHELFDDNATRASPFLFELILMIQFVAMAGALLASRAARRFGAKRATIATLLLWCGVVVYAYAWLRDTSGALGMGVAVGLALGSTYSLARSLFAQMIPAGLEATFFGLYEIASQGTSWLAPLVFTLVVNETGSFREGILSLIVLFAIGLMLLVLTDIDQAIGEARSRDTPDHADRSPLPST
jgi:UMF1 family MFS transporter